MGDGHGGIDKVASSWTLHGWSPVWTRATVALGWSRVWTRATVALGWSPVWTRATVTLRGLKSPSTWMYDSTTYQNHAKNLRVYIVFAPSKLLPLPSYAIVLHSTAIFLELHV